MKIISKFKDYYDYLQGIYGIDDLLTFDRRSDDSLVKLDQTKIDEVQTFTFAIAGTLYVIHCYKGSYYASREDVNNLNKILHKDELTQIDDNNSRRWYFRDKEPIHYTQEGWDKITRKTDVNHKLRKPVLVIVGDYSSKIDGWSDSVVLSDFKLIKALSAHDAFVNISSFLAWLNDHPEIPNKQTNEEKLLSHGFDKKKSFRHRK